MRSSEAAWRVCDALHITEGDAGAERPRAASRETETGRNQRGRLVKDRYIILQQPGEEKDREAGGVHITERKV